VPRFVHRLGLAAIVLGVTALGVASADRGPTASHLEAQALGAAPGDIPETTTTTEVPTTTIPPTTTTTPVQAAALDPSLAPVCGPVDATTPGGAGCRIIAFYGNPLSKKMGVLGATPKDVMLPKLVTWTQTWQTADPATPTKCALELIAITVQASPGPGKLYRARLAPEKIDEVLGWAREAKCLLILDVQVGHSTVSDEVPYLEKWLNEPDVHLGLDPEWDMPDGVIPGKKIGRMSAEDINFGINFVSNIVKAKNLAPKLVIVHRFRDFMVTNPELIVPTPEIRLLVNADGFGPPPTKFTTYLIAQAGMPTQLTGFKLFFKNDKPMLQPKDVLPLLPVPVFINYQ
jgi:hypothetical protein